MICQCNLFRFSESILSHMNELHGSSTAEPDKNYVLDGQHLFSAARDLRLMKMQNHQPVPMWCESFLCKRVLPSVSLSDRQLIAGREQARASQIMSVPLSGRLEWLHKELTAQQEAGGKSGINKSEALRNVYMKCGLVETKDGSVV